MRAKQKRQPTLADIASLAGVAPMTVSRAINHSGYVSPGTLEKITKAIKELHYRPNALARSLRRESTHVAGILLPDVANPFSAALVESIEEGLLLRGYSCFICTTQRSIERETAALSAFVDYRVDGIVVATRETGAGNEALARLLARGVPVVLVGRNFGHPGVDRVTADHWKGGFEVVEHLISLGHRRIAFLGASLVYGAGLPRFRGIWMLFVSTTLQSKKSAFWVRREFPRPTRPWRTAMRV